MILLLSKPNPEIYLHCASSLEAQPKQCLVIEDSPFGIQAGKAARDESGCD